MRQHIPKEAEQACFTIGMFHILCLNNEEDAVELFLALVKKTDQIKKLAESDSVLNYPVIFNQLATAITHFNNQIDIEKVRQMCMVEIKGES